MMEPEPKRALARPTARGRETLAAIEAAARKVIEDKGFLRLTVSDIAAESGRSSASFYNYFDSKEDLVRYWAKGFQDEVRERVAPAYEHGLTARDRIDRSAHAHWDTYRDRLAEMIAISQLAMVDDDFAHYWHDLCGVAIDGIAQTIVRAQSDGYCPGIRPDVTAEAIVAMLNQFCYEQLADRRHGRGVAEDVAVSTLADIWYRAIYWCP